ADLARPSRSGNGLDHPLSEGIGDRDFDLGFRHELDDVLGAPIDLGVAALPPKASDLRNRYARDAQIADGLANLIELVCSDNRRDQFHGSSSSPAGAANRRPIQGGAELVQARAMPEMGIRVLINQLQSYSASSFESAALLWCAGVLCCSNMFRRHARSSPRFIPRAAPESQPRTLLRLFAPSSTPPLRRSHASNSLLGSGLVCR